MTTELRFEIPRPVASKKNRRDARKHGRHHFTVPNEDAKSDEALVRGLAREAVKESGWSIEDTADVELVVGYLVDPDRLEVVVRKHGPRPKGKTGRRRDLHGMVETIADALQGVAYANDNQVAKVGMERVYGDEH